MVQAIRFSRWNVEFQDCNIYLFDHTNSVQIDDCVNCRIFLGPVKTRWVPTCVRGCQNIFEQLSKEYSIYNVGKLLLPPANEVCEGYVFTGVCLSTGRGVCLWSRGVSAHRPRADTPQADTSPAQCMPGYTHTPAQYMLGYTSPLPSACWDMVNKWAVRIPLECILVYDLFQAIMNNANDIMNNINDKRPFPLPEQSWHRTALLKTNTLVLFALSVFIRDCKECKVGLICQQYRTRDCKKIDTFIACVSQPIIEASTGMKFGCLQCDYPELNGML